jgi:hypothetical protein
MSPRVVSVQLVVSERNKGLPCIGQCSRPSVPESPDSATRPIMQRTSSSVNLASAFESTSVQPSRRRPRASDRN